VRGNEEERDGVTDAAIAVEVLGIPGPIESYEEHVLAWHHLDGHQDDLNWIRGALAASVESRYGEARLQEFSKDIGRAYSTVRLYRQVYREFENANRLAFSGLKWKHYMLALPAPPDEREAALTLASSTPAPESEKLPWPTREFKRYIDERYGPDTPPLPAGTFAVIVADPPWPYEEGWSEYGDDGSGDLRRPLPYSPLSLDKIGELAVPDLAPPDGHLFLWTTNRYVRDAYDIAQAWGYKPSQLLVWCKPPRGIGPGGIFSNTAEFVVYARRGSPGYKERVDSTWWSWPRAGHSVKPDAFQDLIEGALEGPYLEMFARRDRPGWTVWGAEA
jgi:N6-adenosine-specific RNA methylase IME4